MKDAKEMNLHTICFPAVGLASQAKGKKNTQMLFCQAKRFCWPTVWVLTTLSISWNPKHNCNYRKLVLQFGLKLRDYDMLYPDTIIINQNEHVQIPTE